MSSAAVQRIQNQIGDLSAPEREDLYGWMEAHCPPEIDAQLALGLRRGVLDDLIREAIQDEANGSTQPV